MTELDHLASPDVAHVGDLLVVPLGSTEQHGPHLPLGTDTTIAVALARGLSAHEPRVVLAPPLAYGASGEHQAFPGTISIGQEALRSVIVELVRSATLTFPRVLLLNAHGGNAQAVTGAVQQLCAEGHDVRAWSPAAVWDGDAHAGEIETSLMLTLAPAGVQHGRATVGNTRPLAELMPQLISAGVGSVSQSGVLGDPTGATPAQGDRLLSSAVIALSRHVQTWLDTPGVA